MRPAVVLDTIRKIDLEGVSRCSINVKDLVQTANYISHLEKTLRESQKEIQRLHLLVSLKCVVPFEQFA